MGDVVAANGELVSPTPRCDSKGFGPLSVKTDVEVDGPVPDVGGGGGSGGGAAAIRGSTPHINKANIVVSTEYSGVDRAHRRTLSRMHDIYGTLPDTYTNQRQRPEETALGRQLPAAK